MSIKINNPSYCPTCKEKTEMKSIEHHADCVRSLDFWIDGKPALLFACSDCGSVIAKERDKMNCVLV